ncbi:chemokine XC receptor 1 [Salminus brasiliensis]|uniref:chemokine XC receptor 1 n=1 Tax=Salminus brasiliensis TaxID=930266 RepID=UPI003B835099
MAENVATTLGNSYPTEYSTVEYDLNYEDELCNKTTVVQFGAIVTPVFFTVVIVLSCMGNALVLGVLVKYENLRSLTNAFLFNLAVSDLVFTVGLPFWAHYHILGRWTFGDAACKAVNFIFFVGFYSSTIFLTTMTVHRYMAVVHPLSLVLNRKPYHCFVISVIIWMMSFGAAAPHVIFTVETNDNGSSPKLHCSYDNVQWRLVGIYQQNIFFLTAFITITFCYSQILIRLLRPTSHTRRKTVRLILCIVVVFFLGWAPYNMAIFLDSLISWEVAPLNECDTSTTVDYVLTISRLVAFSHCCLNPVFYVFMGIKFRTHLKKMLWNICKRMDEPQNRHSQLIYSNGEEISMY